MDGQQLLLEPELRQGIHDDVSEDVYFGLNCLSKSVLGRIKSSPYHVLTSIGNIHERKLTKALQFGKNVHSALLEPGRYRESVVVGPDVDTKQRVEWKNFVKENPGKTHLKPSEAAEIQGMMEGILRNETAKNILTGGIRERTIIAQDPVTKLFLKGRVDFDQQEDTYLVDFKTTANAEAGEFARSAEKYEYPNQCAWYLFLYDLLYDLGLVKVKKDTFLVVAQDSEFPFCCSTFIYDSAILEKAREINRARLDRIGECVKAGHFPAYGDDVKTLAVSSWYFERTI